MKAGAKWLIGIGIFFGVVIMAGIIYSIAKGIQNGKNNGNGSSKNGKNGNGAGTNGDNQQTRTAQ